MGVHKVMEKKRLDCPMTCKTENTDEGYLEAAAEIPECRESINLDTDYRDFPEEKIWSPSDEVNQWIPFYVFMARSVLTFVQENLGIPNREAMENSCTGYAEQYITDILHDSEYMPEVALKTLLTKELPRRLFSRWTSDETELFIQGIVRHGKNFANIQRDLLPRRDMKDIVDFYYSWKWSDSGKELRVCRRQRRPRMTHNFPSISCIFGELSSPKIVTRSVTAAARILSLPKSNQSQLLVVARTTKRTTLVAKRKRKSSAATR
ncbi:arginine-glutamic acid dipeptide repeats protein-like [Hylaeus anthracinus]|uniref:arginine-glutamic acid dipeptide repeats protein-like n=1 Tax=Hylaeus anthracinus TaxID=313031 RepID=UPI0023B91E6B|nr:arginine-glutamic acid dipeptide repeats protein-like [Hylaeus anthracinus]